jgi:hypothetical protein
MAAQSARLSGTSRRSPSRETASFCGQLLAVPVGAFERCGTGGKDCGKGEPAGDGTGMLLRNSACPLFASQAKTRTQLPAAPGRLLSEGHQRESGRPET